MRLTIGFFLILFFGSGMANTVIQDYYKQGNQAYEEGNYSEAKTHYEKAINEGLVHPHLYYNYANSLFRLSELGRAILYYEKALKLDPTDTDIQSNLKYAKAQTVDKHPEPEQNLLTRALWHLHTFYSLNKGLWWLFTLFSMIFIMAGLALFLSSTARWLTYPIIGICIFCILLILPSILFRIKDQASSRYAVVVTKSISIYSGPGDSYEVLAKVHEGTKFEIQNESQGWMKVKLPNGTGGFVEEKMLGKI